MKPNLIGLAFDRSLVDAFWERFTVREAAEVILRDDFRRKVDFRSLLYHKGHLELLEKLENIIALGFGDGTLRDYFMSMLDAGVDEAISPKVIMTLDFGLVCHATALAMSHPYIEAEATLTTFFQNASKLPSDMSWADLETSDFKTFNALADSVTIEDIANSSMNWNRAPEARRFLEIFAEFNLFSKNNRFDCLYFNDAKSLERRPAFLNRYADLSGRFLDFASQAWDGDIDARKLSAFGDTKEYSLQERVRRQRDAEGLLAGMKDDDPLIRQKALESLTVNPELVELADVSPLASDSEVSVRSEAYRVLAAMKSGPSNEVLKDRLETEEQRYLRVLILYHLALNAHPNWFDLAQRELSLGNPWAGILMVVLSDVVRVDFLGTAFWRDHVCASPKMLPIWAYLAAEGKIEDVEKFFEHVEANCESQASAALSMAKYRFLPSEDEKAAFMNHAAEDVRPYLEALLSHRTRSSA